ncbi:Uncharacterised protein [Segatella copri]|nr:Uncharacterised protein [Segatella copri]
MSIKTALILVEPNSIPRMALPDSIIVFALIIDSFFNVRNKEKSNGILHSSFFTLHLNYLNALLSM